MGVSAPARRPATPRKLLAPSRQPRHSTRVSRGGGREKDLATTVGRRGREPGSRTLRSWRKEGCFVPTLEPQEEPARLTLGWSPVGPTAHFRSWGLSRCLCDGTRTQPAVPGGGRGGATTASLCKHGCGLGCEARGGWKSREGPGGKSAGFPKQPSGGGSAGVGDAASEDSQTGGAARRGPGRGPRGTPETVAGACPQKQEWDGPCGQGLGE